MNVLRSVLDISIHGSFLNGGTAEVEGWSADVKTNPTWNQLRVTRTG
jgi:hypothetical protein